MQYTVATLSLPHDDVKLTKFRKPDRSTQDWVDSVNIARLGSGNENPIGNCPWFNTIDAYNSICDPNNSWRYHFKAGEAYQDVVEKHEIGNHIFFRVAGSQYEWPQY